MIADISYHYKEDFDRIVGDASTPPYDRDRIEDELRAFEALEDPRSALGPVGSEPDLLELVIDASSGHRYGGIFHDLGWVLDAIAYWRDPPLWTGPPDGYDANWAVNRAINRRRRNL